MKIQGAWPAADVHASVNGWGCSLRTLCGQEGLVLQMQMSAPFGVKNWNFSKFTVCPHGQGVEPVRSFCGQWGGVNNFSRFCADVFLLWTAPYDINLSLVNKKLMWKTLSFTYQYNYELIYYKIILDGELRLAADGSALPSARTISNELQGSLNTETASTHMLPFWGQFLVHDLALTREPEEEEG